jgi:tRNA (guanine26-N2/guanine27-N2)-dimethyltransferase
VLEALSGTGLRTVRYIKEIPNLNKIVCNDIDPVASELITRNLAFN